VGNGFEEKNINAALKSINRPWSPNQQSAEKDY